MKREKLRANVLSRRSANAVPCQSASGHYDRITKRVALGVFLVACAHSGFVHGAVYPSNGSSADVQAKINSAANGDTVTIPGGSFTWTSGVSNSGKAIKIQGAGSGRIIARSASSVAIGTGTKTFTAPMLDNATTTITAGMTLRIEGVKFNNGTSRIGGRGNFMSGAVTSYSGTTLTMNITSTGGSGTFKLWLISTPATTTIVQSIANPNAPSFEVTETTAGSVEISGIRFAPTTDHQRGVIYINGTASGAPVLIHDCYIQQATGYSIKTNSMRGVLWNCSWDTTEMASTAIAIGLQSAGDHFSSWRRNSTMGMTDTTGANNFYIEDCDLHFYVTATDFSEASRVVFRYNVQNVAGLGTHGPDSGDFSVRHFEVYNNKMYFNGGAADGSTPALPWWIHMRGGTGVWTDNYSELVTSTDYGAKAVIDMVLYCLRGGAACRAQWACWSAGYPVALNGVSLITSAQHGWGWTNGNIVLDPFYIWNNTGSAVSQGAQVNRREYPCGDTLSCGGTGGTATCNSRPTTASFVQQNRDYYLSAKPGYQKYTYPHPLRSGTGGGSPPQAPQNLRILP